MDNKHLIKIINSYISFPLSYEKELLDNTENLLSIYHNYIFYQNFYQYLKYEQRIPFIRIEFYRRLNKSWTISAEH